MNDPLRILHLEDNPDDADLTHAMLRAGGLAAEITRVETRADFLAALEHDRFDLILADYKLPAFDGLSAMLLARQKCPDKPFIFLTGSLGEEVAIEALKSGATDYVLKGRLTRLVPTVQRALKTAHDRAERQRAEASLGQRTRQVIHFQSVLLELAKQDNADLAAYLQTLTAKSAQTLGVARVSIWLYTERRSAILCRDLFLLSQNQHETGMRLEAKDYPRYFQALEENRLIAADDACTDPRTNEFAAGYLQPLGIVSMMDVPIRQRGNVIGVVCHEATGAQKSWTTDEQSFAASIADMVSLALEAADRRHAEEAQLRSERLAVIGQMSAKMAHEIRNPLSAITLNLDLLREDLDALAPPGDARIEELRQIVQSLTSATGRIQRIAQDYLKFGQMPKLERRPLVLEELLTRELAQMQPLFASAKVEVQMQWDAAQPPVCADEGQLWQAVLNLVRNAVEAMPDGGTLTVRTAGKDDQVLLSIADSGRGMSEEQRQQLFKPFFTTKSGGTGLGLALVQQIISEHGGRIECQSLQGKGTTFSILLPRVVGSENGQAGKYCAGG